MFGTIGRRRGEGAGRWSETPLLNVCFNKHEPELAEVDVDVCGTVCADGREEVEGFDTVNYIVEFFPVACEEDCPGAGTVANTNYVALDVGRTVGGGGKGLVVAPVSGGGIGN